MTQILTSISVEKYKEILTDKIRDLNVDLYFISTYPQDVIKIESDDRQKESWNIVSNSYKVEGFKIRRNSKDSIIVNFFGIFEHGGVCTNIYNENEVVLGKLVQLCPYVEDFAEYITWKDQLESLKQLATFKDFNFSELEFEIDKYFAKLMLANEKTKQLYDAIEKFKKSSLFIEEKENYCSQSINQLDNAFSDVEAPIKNYCKRLVQIQNEKLIHVLEAMKSEMLIKMKMILEN